MYILHGMRQNLLRILAHSLFPYLIQNFEQWALKVDD